MDKETVSHVGQILEWVSDNWQFTVLLAGGIFWSMVWAIKKTFPTHKVMLECENDMRLALEKHEREEVIRMLEFKRENGSQHQEIRNGLNLILDHIMREKK